MFNVSGRWPRPIGRAANFARGNLPAQRARMAWIDFAGHARLASATVSLNGGPGTSLPRGRAIACSTLTDCAAIGDSIRLPHCGTLRPVASVAAWGANGHEHPYTARATSAGSTRPG